MATPARIVMSADQADLKNLLADGREVDLVDEAGVVLATVIPVHRRLGWMRGTADPLGEVVLPAADADDWGPLG